MSSAVQALLEAAPPRKAPAAGRYRSMCPCCTPEQDIHPGKPNRRKAHAPRMAWRTRLAAADGASDAGDISSDISVFKDEKCL